MTIYDAANELGFDLVQENLHIIQRGKHYTHEEALRVAKQVLKSVRHMADLLETAIEEG